MSAIVLPCGSTRLSSSVGLGWNGLVVESHRVYAQPVAESVFSDHILEVASGNHVAYGERDIGRGYFRPYAKAPGAMNLYAEGVRPALRPSTTTDLFVCAFDPVFVNAVRDEQDLPAAMPFRGQFGFDDPATANLVTMLEAEARDAGPGGRFYAEHLIYALTSRLLTLGQQPRPVRPTQWGLPKRCLERVIERMRSDLRAPHDLQSLAEVSGYSRNHFLRMFRAATQCTPHRYLLRLRVERAQALMHDRSRRLGDIAAECGFSSQALLSKTFRQVLGMTPTEYRRTHS
ncbi:MAG TPA: helix-turn-helix domain-containing protein [Gemmatimonadaceae bacterium]|nr:helix-turn-helix domain-containing protein [Gemmatimonadaceae bacterium]